MGSSELWTGCNTNSPVTTCTLVFEYILPKSSCLLCVFEVERQSESDEMINKTSSFSSPYINTQPFNLKLVRVFNRLWDLVFATFTQPSPILRRWDRCLKREIEPNQWSHLVLLRLNCLRLGWFGCRVGRHRLIDHHKRLSSCVNLVFFLCPLLGPTYKFTRQKFTQPKIANFTFRRWHA